MPVGLAMRGAAVLGYTVAPSTVELPRSALHSQVWAQAKQGARHPPPSYHSTCLLPQVVSMGQVLTLLGLSVADPLRSAVAVLSIDVPALFVHFECHGIKHSYYAGWLVAANFP